MHGRSAAPDRRRRAQRHRQDRHCCASSPASTSPDAGTVTLHPARRDRRLPAAGARTARRRDRARVPRPPHRRGRGRAARSTQRQPRARRADARRRRPLRRTRSTSTSRSAPPTSTRASARCCADLGLPERVLDLEMPALSGGQAARANLAAILLARFDVFLLDEPTNDLDFAGLDRLERFLHDELAGGAVIVSHDRAFLDRTITRVLELDEHTHSATEYAGGWQAYLDERATARRHAEEEYADVRAQRGDAARPRAAAAPVVGAGRGEGEEVAARPTSSSAHFRRNSSEHVAAKAKITDKALERLEANAVDKPWEGWDLRMEIAAAPRSGAVVCELHGRDRAPRLRSRSDRSTSQIDYGERVAILGANGEREDDPARRRARTDPARRRRPRGSVRAWWSASSTRRVPRSRATRRAARPLRGGERAAAERRAIAAREVRARRRPRDPARRLAVARRAHAGVARAAAGPGRQLPRARRADEPPRPARDRAARAGARRASRARCCSSPTTGRCSRRSR